MLSELGRLIASPPFVSAVQLLSAVATAAAAIFAFLSARGSERSALEMKLARVQSTLPKLILEPTGPVVGARLNHEVDFVHTRLTGFGITLMNHGNGPCYNVRGEYKIFDPPMISLLDEEVFHTTVEDITESTIGEYSLNCNSDGLYWKNLDGVVEIVAPNRSSRGKFRVSSIPKDEEISVQFDVDFFNEICHRMFVGKYWRPTGKNLTVDVTVKYDGQNSREIVESVRLKIAFKGPTDLPRKVRQDYISKDFSFDLAVHLPG